MKTREKEAKTEAENIVIFTDQNGVKHRFVNPMLDKGFKITLGSIGSEEHLKNLLNSILPGINIVNLHYINTERHGMTIEEGKAVFDVYCEDVDGVKFLVEMQNWSQQYFNKRAVYYSTFAVQDQANREKRHQIKTLGKEDWDYNYAPVYVVCFLSFNMKRRAEQVTGLKEDDCISLYRYRDVETNEDLNDGTTLVFVELKKFKKSIDECVNLKEMWLSTLTNMTGLTEIPKEEKGTELEDFFKASELAALSPEERAMYEIEIMSRNDQLNSIRETLEEGRRIATEKGLQLGIQQGLQEGLQQGKIQTARQFKILGVALETIAEATGLTMEQVEAL